MRRLVGILLLSLSFTAHAELIVAQYKKTNRQDRDIQVFFAAQTQAFGWTNVAPEIEHKEKLFCVPRTLTLNNENIYSILDRYIVENPSSESNPVGMILLAALRETFPCK